MKNVIKIFTALLLALTAMPISAVADTDANTLKAVLSTSTQQTTKKNALKRKGMSCASPTKHIDVGTYDENENCVITKCTDGWKLTNDKKACEEKGEHVACKPDIGTWIAGKCNCLYGEKEGGGCKTKAQKQQERTTAKQNRQDAKAQSDAERNYNKDIDKIIDAYNTVTKKIYSKCVADGISIEDCKNK